MPTREKETNDQPIHPVDLVRDNKIKNQKWTY